MNKRTKIIAAAAGAVVILVFVILSVSGGAHSRGGSGKTYTVTFYSMDGTVLSSDTVQRGGIAVPPEIPLMPYGQLFLKWDADFSNVKSDLEIHPVCEEFLGKKNVLAVSGAYGCQGEDIRVPLILAGDVELIGLDAKVSFDPQKVELVAVVDEDGDVMYNETQSGEVHFNYVSSSNTTTDVDILTLRFRVLAESGEMPLNLQVESAYRGIAEDELEKTDVTCINSVVYMLAGRKAEA